MNMNKQYRAELKTLRAKAREVNRELAKLVRQFRRAHKEIDRQWLRAETRTNKTVDRINRRIAILEGRLS